LDAPFGRPRVRRKGGYAAVHPATIFSALAFGHEVLDVEIHGLHDVIGSDAARLGGYFLNALRFAGLNKANALFSDALLNPERAQFYLSKLPSKATSGRWLHVSWMIRREVLGAPTMLAKPRWEDH
jgi:hypothetical protein